jgi:thioesterase domain-containing protein
MKDKICLFLLPGIHYQEFTHCKASTASELLGMARLRHAMRADVDCVLIRYPDWRQMIAARADPEDLVRPVLTQMLDQCGDRPIYLAGYSFGGILGFETARRLAAIGRQVAFLALLDTRWESRDASQLNTAILLVKQFLSKRDVIGLSRLVFRLFANLRAFTLLRHAAIFLMWIGGPRIELELVSVLRWQAWRRLQSGQTASSVPTVLFRCEDQPGDGPRDYGWSALCSAFQVVSIDGDHVSMFTPPHLDRLSTSLVRALQGARANARNAPIGAVCASQTSG